ncbi:MAG: hypothetical protein MK052_02605 [Alphaproteobacteria bacterium]|nr:hypothetical protein [Alphaproteobacteria bacterium]
MKILQILLCLLALTNLTACYTAAVAGAGAGAGYVLSEKADEDDGDLD